MIYGLLLFLLGTLAVDAATTVNATAASCPSPFALVGGRCVHLDFTVSGTWEDMRQFCQGMGSDLIILSDAQFYVDSQQYIRMIGTPAEGAEIWIGASDAQEEGMWLWTDGTPVVMGTPYWANTGCDNDQDPDGGTTQNCALLGGNYHHYLIDASCTSSGHPFCMR